MTNHDYKKDANERLAQRRSMTRAELDKAYQEQIESSAKLKVIATRKAPSGSGLGLLSKMPSEPQPFSVWMQLRKTHGSQWFYSATVRNRMVEDRVALGEDFFAGADQ